MIKSETINIKKIANFDNLYIENELKKLHSSIVRWALIEVNDDFLTISLSYNT